MEEKNILKKMKKNEIKNTAAYLTLSDRFICAGRDELWEKRLGGGGVTFFFSRRGAEWTDTGAVLASVMGYSGAIELLNIPPQLCFNEL